jgi:predicted nucleotidyltransferase
MDIHAREAVDPPSVERLREVVERIARREGYRLAVLFGSHARGERTPRDVDLAIRGSGPLDTLALTNELIRELGYQPVDLCDLLTADALLQALVARDGVPLYEETAGEFDRFSSLAARRFADTRKFRDAERARIRDFLERTRTAP